MRVLFYDTHSFEKQTFLTTNQKFSHSLEFVDSRLNEQTVSTASGFPAICVFTNDRVSAEVLEKLKKNGTDLVALRCAGFNNVDLKTAEKLGVTVVRVPEYSPHAVAEHALALLLTLNRKIHRAYNRVREHNFSLDGLVGFDLYKKTVGVLGTGKIGAVTAEIFKGLGCQILLYDKKPNLQWAASIGARYVELSEIYKNSDIISLHVPLNSETRYLINSESLALMKKGVFLVNTGRGALIDTKALIAHLKSGHVGGACLDVYEEEENIFFHDLSDQVLKDDVLARLLSFPNVLITSHQAFLTKEALCQIAEVTLQNIDDFEKGRPLKNRVLSAF